MDITIIIKEKRVGVAIKDYSNLVQIMSQLQVYLNWQSIPYRYQTFPWQRGPDFFQALRSWIFILH